MLRLSFAAVAVAILLPGGLLAAPGPDASATSQTYDVRLNSRGDGDLTGQFIFQGDANRPQNVETAAFDFSLTSVDDSTVTTGGTGNWFSIKFWIFNFWLAAGDTDSGGQILSYGLVRSNRLFGRSFIRGDGNLVEQGRFRFYGELPAAP